MKRYLMMFREAWKMAKEATGAEQRNRPVRGWRRRDCRECANFEGTINFTVSGGELVKMPLTVYKCPAGRRVVFHGDKPRCGAFTATEVGR